MTGRKQRSGAGTWLIFAHSAEMGCHACSRKIPHARFWLRRLRFLQYAATVANDMSGP